MSLPTHTLTLKSFIDIFSVQYIESRYQIIHSAFLCGRMKVLHLISSIPYFVTIQNLEHGIMGRRFPDGGLLRYSK